jgi:ParB/RepB/Spo0J family partition protein
LSERTKLVKIDPKRIEVPAVRVTSVWPEEEYRAFQASLKADGQITPLIVVKDAEHYWLVDGLHRLQEALLAGQRSIEIAYREGSLVDAATRNLYLNRLRGKTKLSEEIALINWLWEKQGLDPAAIAAKTGLSADAIEQRLAIAKASDYVKDAVEAEQIGLGTAFQLSRLPTAEGQTRLLMALLQQIPPKPTSWVKEVVDQSLALVQDAVAAPPPSEAPIPVRTIRCHCCEERYESEDVRGYNLCASCFGLAKDYIKRHKAEQTEKVSPEQALARQIASAVPTGGQGS